MDKRDIKNLTIEELKRQMHKLSAPPYRAEQFFHWIYRNGVCDFNEMKNIPKPLKEKFDQLYYIGSIKLKKHLKSKDGTSKFLFELSDGSFIETVFIPSGKRRTICLSTQVGCKYKCAFCASGLKGFIRNLTSSEIIEQILFLERSFQYKITNLVFMGMGEPLDNYENVSKSIKIINYPKGLNIGARKITISTCGLIPGIEKVKALGLQVNLSISLHAANDKLRNTLVPINKKYPLEKLIYSCKDYTMKTHRKLTLEYVLIEGVNDSPKDVKDLSSIARRLKAKVNLIPYSPVHDKSFQAPLKNDIEMFRDILIRNRIDVTLRKSKGMDIEAACGQLKLFEER